MASTPSALLVLWLLWILPAEGCTEHIPGLSSSRPWAPEASGALLLDLGRGKHSSRKPTV